MALFKKAHSRSKPIVENASVHAGSTFIDNVKHFTINLCAPGGPPYVYYELQLSEDEMLNVADDLSKLVFSRARRAIRMEKA